MKRLAPILAMVMTASIGFGQSLQQYVALRKQNGVTAASLGPDLDRLIGTKVCELQGVIKGSFKVGERSAIILEGTSCGSVIVDAQAVPDWLLGNETPARLLVKVTREEEHTSLRAILIGAAPEADILKIETEAQKKKAVADRKKSSSTASRGSSTLYGPIGGRNTRGARVAPPTKKNREWILPASEVTPIYARFIQKQNPRLPASEALRIAQGIVGFSIQSKVDARLIMAIVIAESGFDPNAVSRSGAMGLGQLMPGTAKWMGVSNPYDSVENIYGAVKLLRTHLNTYKAQTGRDFDALVLSLAAYNAGEGAVRRAGGVPNYRETQAYVRKVIALYYKLAGLS